MFYYSLKENGRINEATENEKIAKDLGLEFSTEKEIVFGYDGQLYFKGDEPIRQDSYSEKRQKAYPNIGEQLDMIYWDKVNGTSNWQDTITAIKKTYPKE